MHKIILADSNSRSRSWTGLGEMLPRVATVSMATKHVVGKREQIIFGLRNLRENYRCVHSWKDKHKTNEDNFEQNKNVPNGFSEHIEIIICDCLY